MDMVVFGIGFILLIGLSWYFAADSRPTQGDGWGARSERWYPGS